MPLTLRCTSSRKQLKKKWESREKLKARPITFAKKNRVHPALPLAQNRHRKLCAQRFCQDSQGTPDHLVKWLNRTRGWRCSLLKISGVAIRSDSFDNASWVEARNATQIVLKKALLCLAGAQVYSNLTCLSATFLHTDFVNNYSICCEKPRSINYTEIITWEKATLGRTV